MSGTEISKTEPPATSNAELDLQSFEIGLLQGLNRLGLPASNILVPVAQREAVVAQISTVLTALSDEKKAASIYLSKFVAAVAAGLFDAALNYLWDETIHNVRNKAAEYDLNYFFDQAAEPGSDLRNRLHSVDDFHLIDDQRLLIAANRIDLISNVGLQQLDLVRYMRNHASAAHPNQTELRAQQILGYLDACIAEVIMLEPSPTVIEVRRFLTNIKKGPIDPRNLSATTAAFSNMVQEQADNLAMGLFGIYTRADTDTFVLDNIRQFLSHLWPMVSEETRLQFGVKTMRFTANQLTQEARSAHEFLETVEGLSYLPDDMRIPSIDAALDAVLGANRGWNNFAAEGPPARELQRLIGDPPNVPVGIREKYATVLVYVFLTNGSGVSWSANPVYLDLISGFTTDEANFALNSITNETVSNRLHQKLSQEKFVELLDLLAHKIVPGARRDFFEALRKISSDELPRVTKNPTITRLLSEAKRVKSTTRL